MMQDPGRFECDTGMMAHVRWLAGLVVMGIAQTVQRPFIICPALLDLDPEFQIHLAVYQLLDIPARLGTHFLEYTPLLANHDILLTFAFHPDQRMYMRNTCCTFELLDLHCQTIGQLFPQFAEQFLPDQLRCKKPYRT